MFEGLIGAQILSMNEDKIHVKLGDQVHTLEIESYDGDCCGYADFTTTLLYEEENLRNPIITNVEFENNGDAYSDSSTITFYGESKTLATIESDAGSGSGWSYGACVTIRCKTLDIDEDLASW